MLRQREELEEPLVRVTGGGRGGRKHQGCDRSVEGSWSQLAQRMGGVAVAQGGQSTMMVIFELGFRQDTRDTSRESLHCKGQREGLWYPGRKAQGMT